MPKNKNHLKYSSLGFQMAITIGLAAWGGNYLDGKYQTEKPVYTIVLILLGIAIAMYQVIREVSRLSKEDQKNEKKSSK
jgi:F0F1-type ATP synthase assembly protein I